MKSTAVLLFTLFYSVSAAPAVVWKSQNGSDKQDIIPVRTSEPLKSSDLLNDVLAVQPKQDSSLVAVLFLMGRGADGSETFSKLASSGELPQTQAKYDHADCIHHHVSGIESSHSIVREAARANPEYRVAQVNLNELASRLNAPEEVVAEIEITQQNGMVASKAAKESYKRSRDVSHADVLVVHVDALHDSKEIDNAIVSAIEHDKVGTVVAAGIRSTDEVKHERNLAMQLKRSRMAEKKGSSRRKSIFLPDGSRRLEDEQNEGGNGNQGNNYGEDNLNGVYYVSMTPNILSGILFFALFSVVTWIGISCMGMIAGQDVYVDKMPTIGREA